MKYIQFKIASFCMAAACFCVMLTAPVLADNSKIIETMNADIIENILEVQEENGDIIGYVKTDSSEDMYIYSVKIGDDIVRTIVTFDEHLVNIATQLPINLSLKKINRFNAGKRFGKVVKDEDGGTFVRNVLLVDGKINYSRVSMFFIMHNLFVANILEEME